VHKSGYHAFFLPETWVIRGGAGVAFPGFRVGVAVGVITELGEQPGDSIRLEQTTEEALATWDAFAQAIPDKLTSAHTYLAAARDHAFTCLDPNLRSRLARLGGPELGTGVLERLMREINARTDIGARPLERARAARSAHRAHRTATTPLGLEGDQTGHPLAQHYPIPPVKVQRLTTLPHSLQPPDATGDNPCPLCQPWCAH
jgi:hypothetical protein